MDTKKLEVLLRAIELGSLSKAAEEYLYTPSAVSHILDTIEDEIGTKIVKRTYKGIESEEDCKEIIEELKQLVNTEKHIIKLAANKKKGKETINIATYSSISKYILPPIIKGFKEKFPHIIISIIVVDKLREIYDNNIADILFGEKYERADSIWEELTRDPYVAVLPSSFICTEDTIKREKLYESPFIMANDSTINTYMEESKMNDIIRVNSHDDSCVLQMVKQGMGAAILPSLSVENDSGVVRKKLDPELNRILGLIYRKNDFKKKKYLRNFIEYIKEKNRPPNS